MRTITRHAITSFLEDKAFHGGNIAVNVGNNETRLTLYGNCIAIKENNHIHITNAGWFSNTTKERLNAIPDVSIQQIKGKWYLNGNLWNGTWFTIK
jgi:hypothetical protein